MNWTLDEPFKIDVLFLLNTIDSIRIQKLEYQYELTPTKNYETERDPNRFDTDRKTSKSIISN